MGKVDRGSEEKEEKKKPKTNNWEVEISNVEQLAAGEGCKAYSPATKDRPFDSSGFSAKRTLISASAVPHGVNGGSIQGKNDIECTGKVQSSMVQFLAAGYILTNSRLTNKNLQ